MPTFPITSAKDLGLGQTNPGRAPAVVQGVGLIEGLNDDASDAVWCYATSTNPTTLTGQVPGGLIYGLSTYAGQVYVVNDSGVPVMFLDNGALVGTLVVDSLDLGDSDPINLGAGDDLVIVHDGTNSSLTNSTGDLILDNTDVNDQIILRVGTDTSATAVQFRNDSEDVLLEITGAGALTETALASIALTPSGAVTLRGGGTTQLGDDTGYFAFDGSGALSMTGVTTFDLDCSGALQINSSAGAISVGNDAVAQAINIGTGAAARVITIGNTTGATGIVLSAGSAGTAARGVQNTTATATAITGAVALTLADSGGIFTVAQTSAYDIDLPSPTSGAGCSYEFVVTTAGAFDVTITVLGGAATFIGKIINDVTSVIAATGSTLTIASGVAEVGDCIRVRSLATNLYFVEAVTGANGGITVA